MKENDQAEFTNDDIRWWPGLGSTH